MKALVKTKYGVGNLDFMEIPEPECGPDQVKIEVRAAGICGTDLHIEKGEFMCNPPVILGHEFAGIVSETGNGVKIYKAGDRVTVLPSAAVTCGTCKFCKMGFYCFCPTRKGMGHGVNGAFAEYAVAPERIVYPLSDNVSFDIGALSEPLACCVQAVDLAEIKAGDTVVISGPGPIGLLIIQLAKLSGARIVALGTSIDTDRLKLAEELGAELAVNIEKNNVPGIISDFTDGLMADIVFECAGAGASVNQCMKLLRAMGRYVQVGMLKDPISVNFGQIVKRGFNVIGSLGHSWLTYEKSLDFLTRQILNMEAVISDHFPLSEWNTGFRKMDAKKSLKIILTPDK